MPALAPYVPTKDAALDPWAANFSTLITAAPTTYGLLAADAVTIAAVVAAWHTAYLIVTSPTTKTASAVSVKNTDKINMLGIIRPYAQQIANNAGVTSANKIALGLNPKTSTPVPITTPTTTPILTAQSTSTAGTILRFRDSVASPSVKAKPYGVLQCIIYAKASATAITDPTQLLQIAVATKSPVTVPLVPITFPVPPVYFAARWITRKGLLGPFGPIISYNVAG